jgi:hypothetical protein
VKPPILSERDIEARAGEILGEYTRRTGKAIAVPVPIEKVLLQVLDIGVEWEPIPPRGERQIVSKFVQPTRSVGPRIVLNKNLLDSTFAECPGLEQTAVAHETGHALFHLERGRPYQLDLALDLCDDFVSDAESFTSRLARALERVGPLGDDWWREWQAHTFMRYSLMPRVLLEPLLTDGSYRTWPGLYSLRDRLNVTISALRVHLAKLGIVRVDSEGRIHDLTPHASGQRELTFK